MNFRFEKLFSLISPCSVFADVGCDHGYMAEAVLERGMAEHVFITDVSAPSLQKAIDLLSEKYQGKFTSFLTDGLEKVPKADQVLIAGMGGEEIIKILKKSAYKPVILILQPMKNCEKVRVFLHNAGYGLVRDFMFFADGKYYEVLKATLSFEDKYTEEEERFGRENLQGNPDFQLYLKNNILRVERSLTAENLKEESRKDLTEQLKVLRGLLK